VQIDTLTFMNPQTHSQYFKIFFTWLFAAIIVLFFFSSYIKSEALTNIYSSQIGEINTLCEQKDSDLKYYKIINYEKRRKELVLQCVYVDGHQNSEITANLSGEKWVKFRANKLNEKGGFYWPVYL
jgi:hypothetical protein